MLLAKLESGNRVPVTVVACVWTCGRGKYHQSKKGQRTAKATVRRDNRVYRKQRQNRGRTVGHGSRGFLVANGVAQAVERKILSSHGL